MRMSQPLHLAFGAIHAKLGAKAVDLRAYLELDPGKVVRIIELAPLSTLTRHL
jgi:hypothetical protein